MAFKINHLSGTGNVGSVTVDRRLYLTEDDRLVEPGDPDARWLWAVEGREMPADEAERYGYQPKSEPKPADKQAPAPPDKSVQPDDDKATDADDNDGDGEGEDDTPDADTEDEPEHVCDECGFEAKNAAGLGSHQRTHED